MTNKESNYKKTEQMENKTAVEQLIEHFKDWLNCELGHDPTSGMLLEQVEAGELNQYLEIEKQQIIDQNSKDKKGYNINSRIYYSENYPRYYEFFKFMSDEHGLTLLDSEIQDIIQMAKKYE